MAELGLDPAWYNVARLLHDLGVRSYVVGIITDARIDGRSSTTFGVDSTWYITQDLSLLTDVMRVDDDESEATSAYYAGLDLTTDPWGFLFSFRQIDDGFDPEVGFVRRDGFRSGSGSLRRSIRPGAWGVRRVSFRLFATEITPTTTGTMTAIRPGAIILRIAAAVAMDTQWEYSALPSAAAMTFASSSLGSRSSDSACCAASSAGRSSGISRN